MVKVSKVRTIAGLVSKRLPAPCGCPVKLSLFYLFGIEEAVVTPQATARPNAAPKESAIWRKVRVACAGSLLK